MSPTLLLIFGPPAVGKMSVGHEIAERTGLRLFHNHIAIEPALRYFEFGTPPFQRLVDGFRQAILDEVAASDLPGLVFTFVWAFDHPGDARTVAKYVAPFGDRARYLELEATQEERLRRNTGEFRLAEKPSKRNLEFSRRLLLADDERYRLNSIDEFTGRDDYLRINNTDLTPAEVADRTITRFGLPWMS
ncbi:AAA family ATPase [Actinoplanes friuliensis]|uniref:Shikimate kinase n=1 Tax=Actinoplanes friuliensis DSM 7358 TaxID=1246995 RepID=U5WCV4_9ACTN|nr:AAA family ATPase [Actinoplanes friuliensis]AGZ45761.1 hypothetical protein AFR_37535 [Actinoplanes friuliensis DSM 7358]